MKVRNSSGREYYIQRAKDDRMANWCSRVTPVVLEFDGVRADAYADTDRSDWIYIRFNDTTYCHWAKEAGGFDLLDETHLEISDHGRTYRKRDHVGDNVDNRSSSKSDGDDRLLTREDLEAVVAHLPALKAAVAERDTDPATKGHEYSKDFGSIVRQIVHEFHSRQFMYAFDYMGWMDEGRRLMEDSEGLAAADLETIRKLLVVHWRSDYWDSDNEHWEHIAATGHLSALLERLAVIAIELEPSPQKSVGKFTWEDGDIDKTSIQLPESDSDNTQEFVPPGSDKYKAAFAEVRESLTENQLRMLRAHYHSGGRAITVRELATAMGYDDFNQGNLQYGSLAKKLLRAMGRDARVKIMVFGELVSRREFGLEMHIVMHDAVAAALKELKWFNEVATD
ncbi:MAG: hypothetical protein IPM28_00050 [Chloracidobacterium sp.]|nr:hypothetical protein [Chloracidobacterium sp.]